MLEVEGVTSMSTLENIGFGTDIFRDLKITSLGFSLREEQSFDTHEFFHKHTQVSRGQAFQRAGVQGGTYVFAIVVLWPGIKKILHFTGAL